jgi:hypothetical protein
LKIFGIFEDFFDFLKISNCGQSAIKNEKLKIGKYQGQPPRGPYGYCLSLKKSKMTHQKRKIENR